MNWMYEIGIKKSMNWMYVIGKKYIQRLDIWNQKKKNPKNRCMESKY